jgi:hypothetical protein
MRTKISSCKSHPREWLFGPDRDRRSTKTPRWGAVEYRFDLSHLSNVLRQIAAMAAQMERHHASIEVLPELTRKPLSRDEPVLGPNPLRPSFSGMVKGSAVAARQVPQALAAFVVVAQS